MSTRPRRLRRLLAALAAVTVGLITTWAVWAWAVIQTPRVDATAPVDAVLVLGGLDGIARTARAFELVSAGLTNTVVLSMPVGTRDALARNTCHRPPAGVDVICFTPDPSTTRGEAREIRRLAAERDWTRIAVVTSAYHVSRSRLIVSRCFKGTILMLASREHVSAPTWAYHWIYQTAGYAKAEVLRGC